MKNQKPETNEPPVRATVIAAVILAAMVGLLVPVLTNDRTVPTPPATQTGLTTGDVVAPVDTKTSPATETVPSPVAPNHGAAAETPVAAEPQDMNDDYVAVRVDELRDLAMTGNISSLTTIESELNDPDRRIRDAAVSAAIQFGDRSAIPALQTAITRTEDPQEKINLQKAVDFLELPSMTDMAVNHADSY